MMESLDTQRTVAELVTERPARARVFERHGIDYCCGGHRPLVEAAVERGVVTASLLAELAAVEAECEAETIDWSQRSMTELADHIEQTHHEFLRTELPRLTMLVDKVANVHGAAHPWMIQIRTIFGGLCAELDSHMMKEEQILFPICRQLEQPGARAAFHCGSVRNPIRVMEHEHDNAAQALEAMRELSSGYTPPEGACNTFRVVLDSLAQLEGDLHRHIHKENHILFPKAAAAEAALLGQS